MTISSTGTRFSYSGNGATTAFSFPRQFFADADLDVYLVDQATGVATLQVLNTHYTVAGAGSPSGGTVTMLTAPPTGKTLVIVRDTAPTQGLDLDNVTALPMTSLEAALDRAMMVVDEIKTMIGRAIMYPLTGLASFDWTFPTPVATQVLGVNAAGSALEMRRLPAWLNGAGVPNGGNGVVGDYYLDTTNGDVYLKTNIATWTLQANIRGTPGIPGSMTGPGSSVSGNLPTFASTSGTLLQDSGFSLSWLYGYTAIVSGSGGGTTTLTVGSTRYIVVTGSTTHTIVLPVVSTLLLGTTFRILNLSSGNVTVQSSGANTVATVVQFGAADFTSNAITGTAASVWHALFVGGTVSTGFGSIVFHNSATHNRIRFNAANAVTAGTNAQGQGALTETVNMITTAANNPSGVTLPSPSSTSTTSSWVTVINKGANPVNVYPASGHQIDALGSNNPIILPVGGVLTFFSLGTTQWYSSNTGSLISDGAGSLGIGTVTPNWASLTAMFTVNAASSSGFGLKVADAGALYIASAATYSSLLELRIVPLYLGNNNAVKAQINTSGDFIVTGGGGLGYGTGSGGAVTQLTSKSTGVTLNKTTGTITMNAAALGAGASVIFALSNSTIGATDLLLIGLTGGSSNALNYRVELVNCGSSGANIKVTNISAGSLSEALQVTFAVIRAVNS